MTPEEMPEQLQRAFMIEVNQQATLGLRAVDLINAALTAGDSDLIWLGITSLLSSAANISKVLWPTPPAEPRQPLLDVLAVDRSSRLADRRLRNHFEHIDDRIETWWRKSPRRNMVDTFIGPPSAIGGVDVGDMFRCFDPRTNVVSFQGDAFDLAQLVAELERIWPLSQPPWFGVPARTDL